jgi:Protein of unknown function (DUF3429)
VLFDDPHLVAKERMAKRLSYAGFAPFAVLAVWLLWSAPGAAGWDGALIALRGYAIAILSFVAGIRWGGALLSEKAPRIFLFSVIPPLIASMTVFLAPVLALAILAMTFAAQGAWDVIATQNGELPAWYGELRMRVTILVVGALLVAIIAHG